MNHTQVLDVRLLISQIEVEDLAVEILEMVEQTLTQNHDALNFIPPEINQMQFLLHQLKGILPMLTESNFTTMLRDEEQHLREHLSTSANYPTLLNQINILRTEIQTYLNALKKSS